MSKRTYDELTTAIQVSANAGVPMTLTVQEMWAVSYAMIAMRLHDDGAVAEIERVGWVRPVMSGGAGGW